jgi:hypothetical protein
MPTIMIRQRRTLNVLHLSPKTCRLTVPSLYYDDDAEHWIKRICGNDSARPGAQSLRFFPRYFVRGVPDYQLDPDLPHGMKAARGSAQMANAIDQKIKAWESRHPTVVSCIRCAVRRELRLANCHGLARLSALVKGLTKWAHGKKTKDGPDSAMADDMPKASENSLLHAHRRHVRARTPGGPRASGANTLPLGPKRGRHGRQAVVERTGGETDYGEGCLEGGEISRRPPIHTAPGVESLEGKGNVGP